MKKNRTTCHTKNASRHIGLVVGVLVFGFTALTVAIAPGTALAACATTANGGKVKVDDSKNNAPKYCCGSGSNAVGTSIDIGCKGQGNPITDMVFAVIRFLSNGAGIVIVASLIWAGIQYILARDDPSRVGQAKERIMNTLGALLIFIFAYAILNYVIPAGFFK